MGILNKTSNGYNSYPDYDFPDPNMDNHLSSKGCAGIVLKCLVVGLVIIILVVGVMYWINNL